MVAAAHRRGDGGPSRDGQCLSEGGKDPGARPGRTATGLAAKTGHHAGGVHRLRVKIGNFRHGVHRLERAKTGHQRGGVHRPHDGFTPRTCAEFERVRAIRELIAEALGRGRNAMAIWQDLVDDHGFTGQYASVRRFVVKLRGAAAPEARVVITTAPGEEGQVDYGDGPMVRYPQTGKYRRTRLFVLTLGYSRKAVRLLVWHSSTQVWAELHERAFRRLGGCDPQKFLPTHKVSEFRAIGLRKAICGRSGA
jgi:hypothetical protein